MANISNYGESFVILPVSILAIAPKGNKQLFLINLQERTRVMTTGKNPYIPFERLTGSLLERALEEGMVYWIVQRLNWPGLAAGRAFIVTPYGDETLAREHEGMLAPKEGKLLNIRLDKEKIDNLQQEQSPYLLFFNSFADRDWEKKLMANYGDKIQYYVKYISPLKVRGRMHLDIFFYLEYGRLMAMINCEDKTDKVTFFDMIK